MSTKIEWCDATINPVVGCSKCSPGCDNCYAEKFAARMAHNPKAPHHYRTEMHGGGMYGYRPIRNNQWSGQIVWDFAQLERIPKTPCRVFVGSMCDLFHQNIGYGILDKIWSAFKEYPRHTFMVLTKRAKRLPQYLGYLGNRPLPNVWLGVTVCNPDELRKMDYLRRTPAAIRFVSFEPLLSDLGEVNLEGIDWVICGGETGPRARPLDVKWVRRLRDQCQVMGVPFFFKSFGAYSPSDVEHTASGAVNKTGGRYHFVFDKSGVGPMRRLGKKYRLLDGVEHSDFPGAA